MRRVLSMWQPWAAFTMPQPNGGPPLKAHETRHWSPLGRAGVQRLELPIPVVIHATKKFDRAFLQSLGSLYNDAGAPRILTGMLIGVATVVEVLKTEEIADHWRARIARGDPVLRAEMALGDYSPGRFAWKLADVQELPQPIPFKGRQEPLYKLEPEIDRFINRQLEAWGK